MDAKSHPGVRAGHGNESISPHTKTLYPSKSCSNQRRAIPFPRPFPSHLSSPAHLLLAPCTLPPSSPPKFTQPRKSRSHLSHSVALRSPPKITRPENPNLGRFSTEFYLFNGGTFIHARARAWLSLFFPPHPLQIPLFDQVDMLSEFRSQFDIGYLIRELSGGESKRSLLELYPFIMEFGIWWYEPLFFCILCFILEHS